MRISKTTIFFVVAVLVLALGAAGFLYWRGQVISNDILTLTISAPAHAAMGDEIEYTVTYKNNGNFELENAKLAFQLPDNSLIESSTTLSNQAIGNIYPGQENFIKFYGRLLGKEGDVKTAKAFLAYTPHNLSAQYEADASSNTTIDTVPITLTYDAPVQAAKGNQMTYSINYASAVDYPLENMSIKVDSMTDFTITSATPASLDNAEFKLITLQRDQGGKITIMGTVATDAQNPLHISAHIGMWVDGTFIVLKDVSTDIQVVEPTNSPLPSGNSSTTNPPQNSSPGSGVQTQL
jgi:uncharacterized repeat protein (TIGR01451 family)